MSDTRTRRRGRAAHSVAKRSVDYQTLINPFEPVKGYSDDQIAQIHDTALTVLETLGVRILHDGARTRLAAAGASVDGTQVRFDRGMIEAAIARAPAQFTLTGCKRTLHIGGRSVHNLPVGGPPHFMTLDDGKQPGTHKAFRDMIRLAQTYDVIHLIGPSVEPQDIAPQFRHLEMTRTAMTDSDKPMFIYARGRPQTQDNFAMIAMRMGLDETAFRARPHCYTVINTNSPLILDLPMCQGMIDFAEAGQISIVTPFTLAGAMAPVTIPGALVQQHAEFLSALTLIQTVSPGAPVIYGGFTSNVDMRSGAPTFGTPEYVRACWGTGQLARLVDVPWRSSASCTANTPDAQAAMETQMALWGAVQGGANIIIHAAGWLEGGLSASYEKFILDIELLQHMAELMQPVPFDDGELGLEAIREVGSGGHHFGTAHTRERYQTAFYAPFASDLSTYGQWQDNGAQTAAERANGIWKDVLARFEAPPLDPAVREALDDFVERRTAEGGAMPES